MCDCITQMGAILAPRNTRLSLGFSINTKTGAMHEYPVILSEKIDKRSRVKQVQPIPTFCPFCGEKYRKDEALAMSDRIPGGNAVATITFSADAPPEIATSPTDREIIAALVEALQWVKCAQFTLESDERDYGEPLPEQYEIGRIHESRESSSFRICVGHLRKLYAALKLAGA